MKFEELVLSDNSFLKIEGLRQQTNAFQLLQLGLFAKQLQMVLKYQICIVNIVNQLNQQYNGQRYDIEMTQLLEQLATIATKSHISKVSLNRIFYNKFI